MSSLFTVTHTWGCACAAAVAITRPADAAKPKKNKRRIIDLLARPRLLVKFPARWRHDITDCGGMEARKFHVHDKVTRNLHPRGAAIGARIMTGFEPSIRVKHDRAGMAHDVRITLRQHLDVVACREQPLDQSIIETRFHT